MIVETVGSMRLAKDDVIRVELNENNRGKFLVVVEQFDPVMESGPDNPSERWITLPEEHVHRLIGLLQSALHRTNSFAAQ